jgi:alpha-galactosidase
VSYIIAKRNFIMMRFILRLCATSSSFVFVLFALLSWTASAAAQQRGILTPPPPLKPQINGPAVFGVHPRHPFLYRIPATGTRPMTFSAQQLPAGLHVDAKTGIIRGEIKMRGEYAITLEARNSLGSAKKQFRIVVGEKIALTPPMGWSTWYMAYTKISDKFVRSQADAMVSSGLVNYGYSDINIDDGWNIKPSSPDAVGGGAPRVTTGNLRSNRNFPDMRALADSIHSKGLKIGIYTSPGPLTCGGYEGSYRHEAQDASLFAVWGFDFVKYDLCSYRKILKSKDDTAGLKQAYRRMGSELQKQNRDFVYNLCEYGNGDVWKWGREVGGNMWRTAGDVGASKPHEEGALWRNIEAYGFGQAGIAKWAGPGGWNDPDNILIGQILWNGALTAAPLTHNEQYSYVTLWSLMASPLIFGGDMTQLDPFTLSLLTNTEVIAVDQDAAGRQAVPVSRQGDLEVWAKDMQDGSKAIGLFNRGEQETAVTARWADLGIRGRHSVRDLWRQKNVGVFDREFHASVGPHGAEMFLINANRNGAPAAR